MTKMESLEPRQLLAATLDAGLLTLTGTDLNDQINVSSAKKGKITVTHKTVVVTGNQTLITNLGTQTFDAAAVTAVVVNLGAGDDALTLTGSKKSPYVWGTTVDCGAGNDRVTAGAGADRLTGGDGNDRLSGGAGNDTAYGDAGDDRLYGNDGNDRLFGGVGGDQLTGHLGDDWLDGGLNDDRLYAEDAFGGNDTVEGGGADKSLRKNSGDYAVIDFGDQVTKDPVTTRTTVKRVVTIAA